MPSLKLSGGSDSFDLDYVAKLGKGVQVLSGVTGLGLPPVAINWLEGAGDGSTYRGKRVLSRDIDLPLYIRGTNRDELKSYVRRLSIMLAGQCRLSFVDDREDTWYADVHRVGGGDFSYGIDTNGQKELFLVVTLRAADPYFTSVTEVKQTVASSASKGMLAGGSLVKLKLSPSQTIGTITMNNLGDAVVYPTWKVYGPANMFKATSPSGQSFTWSGSIPAGEILTVDTKAGTIKNKAGVNLYDQLGSAPRFWTIPQGSSVAKAELTGISQGISRIECLWHARKWLVI